MLLGTAILLALVGTVESTSAGLEALLSKHTAKDPPTPPVAQPGIVDKLAAPFINSKLLGPHNGQAGPEFTNRWAMVLPAFGTHLCIGSPWAWSVLSDAITREHGFVTAAASDWTLAETTVPMMVVFGMQGLGAAVAGTWQMKVGMRASMVVAGCCFGFGHMFGALGVAMHSKALLYAGYGFLGGCGVGVAYTPPLQALMQWFPDKKGLASGLVICGFGGGGIVLTKAGSALMSHYSVTPTYLGTEAEVATTTVDGVLFSDGVEVVLANSVDLGKLTADLAEGYYVVGSGNTGVTMTMLTLGGGYLGIMLTAAFTMQRPHESYVPDGYVPPDTSGAEEKNVDLQTVMTTPQFALLSTTFFCLATGGMGMMSVAKPMMADIFSGALPQIVTASFGSTYLLLLSGANLSGRVGWAAISDKIGRRNTFHIFTFGSVPLYCLLPTLVASVVDTNQAAPLYAFMGSSIAAITMMGGTYAIMPAYEADLYGTKYVGPIHGRFLLFGAGAAGMAGPQLLLTLRSSSERSALDNLLSNVEPSRFHDYFGVALEDGAAVEQLISAKTLTIAKLMSVAPDGTQDPTPFIYDNVMYAMGGLMATAALAHSMVGPVNDKYFEKLK